MRVFNFSAGPAVLPEPVLQQAAAEMMDWHGSGMSVMEMSHRGKEFIGIADQAEADLRTLLAIPANYKVLFLQGGAIAENAIVPMNLLAGRTTGDYVNTGEWSKKSLKEAKKYCTVNIAATAEDKNFTYVPVQNTWKLTPGAAFVHVCTNETIGGVEYQWTPDTGDIPLVADMSSHLLSRPVDIAKFGVIYGGAQKNMGPAGLTLVIVRDDLLDRALPVTPSAFHWKEQAAADSMLNTPPTYAIYIAGLTFQWLMIFPVLLLQIIFNAGLALFVSRLGAKVHDIRQLIPYIMRIWMYGSAILYPVSFFAERVHGWQLAVVEANPLLIFIELTRHSLMEGITLAGPPGRLWIEAVIWTVLVGIGGYVYFWRGEKGYGRG